jgi:hypothetical protein
LCYNPDDAKFSSTANEHQGRCGILALNAMRTFPILSKKPGGVNTTLVMKIQRNARFQSSKCYCELERGLVFQFLLADHK